MDLLGGVTDGLMGGLNPISMIKQGIDLVENLVKKHDGQDARQVLDLLMKFINQSSGQPGQAAPAQAQPFTPPQTGGDDGTSPLAGAGGATGPGVSGGTPGIASGSPGASGPPIREIDIDIKVKFGDQPAQSPATPVSHPVLPIVDGSAAQDAQLTQAASQYVEGSAANKARALTTGSQEWYTVCRAMQQNPNVRYDADSKRFFELMSDGSKRDLGSLADAQKAAPGMDRNNPPDMSGFLGQKTQEADDFPQSSNLMYRFAHAAAQTGMSDDDINQYLDTLRPKLQDAERGMQTNGVDFNPMERAGVVMA